ncbi:MAG: squalene synthase HpnC [Ignavibacteriaceae bacterium]
MKYTDSKKINSGNKASMKADSDIESAYKKAIEFAVSHYENFPVISFFLNNEIRKHVAIIYWFARTADDIADEGVSDDEQRLSKLNRFEERLRELLKGNPETEFEKALKSTVETCTLDTALFFDLLKAFKQDVTKNRFGNADELFSYCRYSANPVGRLFLQLHGIHNPEAYEFSDKICTALQLTNFLQDVPADFKRNRIYFPADEMNRTFVTENMFELNKINDNLKLLVIISVERAQKLFDEGKPLLKFLAGKLKFQIKWTILGGEEILNKIRKNNFNIFDNRPELSKTDFIRLLIKSFI